MSKRPVSIDDLFCMKIIDDPDVDRSGSKVAFTVTRLDRDLDVYLSQIWVHDVDRNDCFALTNGQHRDTHPQWSPDGSAIAFLSNRADDDHPGSQVFVVSVAGGEPRRLTTHEHGIDMFEWSPAGDRLLFVASQPEPRNGPSERETDVRVITTARYRADGAGYLDDRFKQVFTFDIRSGDSRQLTSGRFDHQQAAWSPNGSEIAFVSNRRSGWEFSQIRDIYLIKSESGHVRQLTHGDGRWSLPSWSPDGRQLAAYGSQNLTSAGARNELFVISIADRQVGSVTAHLDIDFRDSTISDWNGYGLDRVVWLDSEQLLAVAGIRGNIQPAVIDISSGDCEFFTGPNGRVGHPQPLKDGSIVAVRSDFSNPGELVRIGDDSQIEAITAFNQEWLESVELSVPRPFEVQSTGGETVAAWLMPPVGIAADEKTALLLEIHGGPFGMYGDTFMHEFQLLAGKGYGVLFTNPRGSAGYGQRFAEALLPEMGEKDLPDLMAALDQAVAEPWVDPARLGVLGGSYGGFMTNWVVAHTDRFRRCGNTAHGVGLVFGLGHR